MGSASTTAPPSRTSGNGKFHNLRKHLQSKEAHQHAAPPANRRSVAYNRESSILGRNSSVFSEGKMFTSWNFGRPTYICHECGAMVWFEERVKRSSTNQSPKFSICCQRGKVDLPKYEQRPELLISLLKYDGGPDSKHFRENIRAYNSLFAFTSMGGHIDNSINNGRGPYVFRLNGQNHHRVGSLLPTDGIPRFSQLYFYDTTNEVDNRIGALSCGKDPKVACELVTKLVDMFNNYNVLAKVFKMTKDQFEEVEFQSVRLRLVEHRSRDHRQYTIPTCNEVAALVVGSNASSCGSRDILIEERSGVLKRINEQHPSFMVMQYPIIFPYGEDGFMPNINYRHVKGGRLSKRGVVTMREFYAYLLQYKPSDYNIVLLVGRLLQQLIVDCYTCVEERLGWVMSNQSKIRAELYCGLQDAITEGDVSAISIERRIVLPSSFTSGPRYMIQNYQDAMAICRWAGSPYYCHFHVQS